MSEPVFMQLSNVRLYTHSFLFNETKVNIRYAVTCRRRVFVCAGDLAMVLMGPDAKNATIIVAAKLRQMGIRCDKNITSAVLKVKFNFASCFFICEAYLFFM